MFCIRHLSSLATAKSTPLLAKIFRGFLQDMHLQSLEHFPLAFTHLHLWELQPEVQAHTPSVLEEEVELDGLQGFLATENQNI